MQLSDKQKIDAYNWLAKNARVEDRDGGWSAFYRLPNIPKKDGTLQEDSYWYESFDEAISWAMAE